ncbi:hypothetical protein [Georgenia subflava]|uniref:Uncharacterized protein n=1 Tax=Georgenia subflava TaxID=1622177 RepID=A0A6N7EDT3_9MICO|nr:hypothetical protein [Georgenia subflava]MPV36170.1 hypothetical protein [Georgenia subflava]
MNVSPDPRVWVGVPMAWPTAVHASAQEWAAATAAALVADQQLDEPETVERLGAVLAAVADLPHPDHVQACYLHLPDVHGALMLLEISAVATDTAANRHLLHRGLTDADRPAEVGAVQVEDGELADGCKFLRVLRFERAGDGGPLGGILRHAVRQHVGPHRAVDVTTTISGTDIEGLLHAVVDVETMLEDMTWTEERETAWVRD